MEAPSRTVQKEGTLCILVRRLLHSLMHIERNEMFEEKVERKDLVKMPAEYIELLGRVLTIQADCEIGGPHLYVKDMLLTAPSKVNQLIVARTAAEEMDHYRKIARLAGDMGIDVSGLLSVPNHDRYLEAFRGTITTWEDFSVFGFLIKKVDQ